MKQSEEAEDVHSFRSAELWILFQVTSVCSFFGLDVSQMADRLSQVLDGLNVQTKSKYEHLVKDLSSTKVLCDKVLRCEFRIYLSAM